jgi:fumarate hydratase class II
MNRMNLGPFSKRRLCCPSRAREDRAERSSAPGILWKVHKGNFQLNAYKPVILHNVLDSNQLLADPARSVNDRCARGIAWNEKRIRQHLDNSLMLLIALNPHIGYEEAAQISLTAFREDLSLREAALKLGALTAEQFDE